MRLSDHLKNSKTDLNEVLGNVIVEVDKWGRRLFHIKDDVGAGSKLTLNEIIKIVEERFEQDPSLAGDSDRAAILAKVKQLDAAGNEKLTAPTTRRYKRLLHPIAHLWGRIFFNRGKHLKKVARLAQVSMDRGKILPVSPSSLEKRVLKRRHVRLRAHCTQKE